MAFQNVINEILRDVFDLKVRLEKLNMKSRMQPRSYSPCEFGLDRVKMQSTMKSTSFVVPLHHGKAFFWRHLFSPAKLIDIILSTNTKLLTLSSDQNTKPNHKTDLKTNPNPKNSIGPNKPEKKKNGRTLFKSSYCIS